MNIYIDSPMDDAARRQELYRGSLFVYAPAPSALKLCEFARVLVEEAFPSLDPLRLQESLPVEKCVEILAMLKPKFIHHLNSKKFIQSALAEMGCDLEKTYFDVPRLRTAFPGDYLKSGIAYAFHPHRDTWYSAPFCQINWWMPVYPLNSENNMAFHPQYWNRPIKNGSSQYDYERWNRESRHNAAQHVKTDTRVQPRPEEPIEFEPQLRIVGNVGSMILFSGAHLHSTVPNTSGLTRYSIDFRTVHLGDVCSQAGAPNIDSACTGTTMRDYLRGSDLKQIPDEAVASYDGRARAMSKLAS